jgi:hypothetical protein
MRGSEQRGFGSCRFIQYITEQLGYCVYTFSDYPYSKGPECRRVPQVWRLPVQGVQLRRATALNCARFLWPRFSIHLMSELQSSPCSSPFFSRIASWPQAKPHKWCGPQLMLRSAKCVAGKALRDIRRRLSRTFSTSMRFLFSGEK